MAVPVTVACRGGAGEDPAKEGLLEEVTTEPSLKASASSEQEKGNRQQRGSWYRAGGRQVTGLRAKPAVQSDPGMGDLDGYSR